MQRPLRIALAEDEIHVAEYLERLLALLGHVVVASARNGMELVESCRAAQPDLVITDIKMPELDGLDAARLIFHDRPVPIILLSAYHDEDLIERAGNIQALAYLVKPIKVNDLAPSISLAMSRFAQVQTLRRETQDLRQALHDRELIERAKNLMMQLANLNEPDAFRRLQKLANDKRCKLVDVARTILIVEEGFQTPARA